MAVTGAIPLPGSGIKALSSGLDSMFQDLMNKKKLAQQNEQFKQKLALEKQQEGRLGANSDIQRAILQQQLMGLQNANNPNYKFDQFRNLMNNLNSMQGNNQNQQSEPTGGQEPAAPGALSMLTGGQPPMGQGQGVMPDQNPFLTAMQQGQSGGAQPTGAMNPVMEPLKEPNNMPGGIDINEIMKGLAYQAAGLKPPTPSRGGETPAQKLQGKMEEAKYKHELKQEEEKTKAKLADDKTRQKTIDTAKADVPHLEETLRSLQAMKKIAQNNPDLFGHWFIGNDREAQRTKNPNAGAWQTYGLDPIVAAEGKMSARGNQLALKSALANKPNFGENQNVAISKIDASIDKLKRQIEQNNSIANNGAESGGGDLTYNPATGRLE